MVTKGRDGWREAGGRAVVTGSLGASLKDMNAKMRRAADYLDLVFLVALGVLVGTTHPAIRALFNY